MKLIIVESPVKIRTIKKYLDDLNVGGEYELFATNGHILDLNTKEFSVTRLSDGTFKGTYEIIKGKKSLVSALKSKVRQANDIYMCQDDDREGEKIAEDIVEVCKIKKYYRVVLLSITRSEIERVFVKKIGIREIDDKIVRAQITRRIIDRIVGYGLSPALNYYFSSNKILSFVKDNKEINIKPNGTGRVIGISLSLLANREKDIRKYKQEGEKITDVVKARYNFGTVFDATGEKLEFSKKDDQLLSKTIVEANSKLHKVYSYNRDIKEVPPYPAFTTAALYSACSYIYDMPSKKTKDILVSLFYSGYITYPRTDNSEISNDAANEIISYLFSEFDESDYGDILKNKRRYKKRRNLFAQEGHEAIRPLFFTKEYEPNNIFNVWNKDSNAAEFGNYHKYVYELIWQRAVSTQLADSVYDVSKVVINAGQYTFTATANDRTTDGWEKYFGDKLKASSKGKGDDDWTDKRVVLPEGLYVGCVLENVEVYSYERKSRSPKRISEGALITQLVTNGIARPSTLHSIVSSLVKKKYVTTNRTLIILTELGMAVSEVTQQYLEWLNDIKAAQDFEKIISLIEKGEINNPDAVIQKYWDKVEEFKREIGYITNTENGDEEPTEKQKEYARKIIDSMDSENKKNINIESIFLTKKEMNKFLNAEVNKGTKEKTNKILGKCPKCNSNSIIEHKDRFACNNRECDFVLWNNNIERFIELFSVKERKNELIRLLLNSSPYSTTLISPKTQLEFKANISLTYNKKYKNWNIEFVN